MLDHHCITHRILFKCSGEHYRPFVGFSMKNKDMIMKKVSAILVLIIKRREKKHDSIKKSVCFYFIYLSVCLSVLTGDRLSSMFYYRT